MRKIRFTSGAWILLAAISLAAAGTPASRNSNSGGKDPDPGLPGGETATLFADPSPAAGSRTLADVLAPVYTIRRTVPEVRFQFSVADERGQLKTRLSAGDFRIFDNQAAVPQILEFSLLEELPLQMGILLDLSDSVQRNVVREKLASQFLVQQVLRPQTDRAFLMAFAGDVTLWQPSTGDPGALRQALQRVNQQGYVTNLYDGLFSACSGQFPQTGKRDEAQRVILVFSDGEDTGSLHGMPDVISLAQRREIQIFALSVHARRKSAQGDEVLRRLADETGGGFYVAASDTELPAVLAQMEHQMRTQYFVSFQPQQQTPGFHAVRLEFSNPQKLRIHARSGYYFDAP